MLKTNVNFNDIRRIFIKVRKVLLVAHPNPDLDCLCAMKVIQFLLDRYFAKKAVLYSKDPVNPLYKHLFNDVVNEVNFNDFDCVIAVELGSFKRFSEVVPEIGSKLIINIDHHSSNDLFGNYYYVDVNSSAVNEVLYDIIKQTGIPLDNDIAYYLAMGIISDTGMLSYNNVGSKTLLVLSELRNYVDWQEIFSLIKGRSFYYYKMLSVMYNNLQMKGDIVYSYLRYNELEELIKLGLIKEELNNIVDNIMYVLSGKVFFTITEVEPNYCRVNLRSKGIDVEQIAIKFGGGGHKRASGFRIKKSVDELINILINELGGN